MTPSNPALVPRYRQAANTIAQLSKRDTAGTRGLRQQARRSQTRQRIHFQAPQHAIAIEPKIGATITIQFQRPVCAQRQSLFRVGLGMGSATRRVDANGAGWIMASMSPCPARVMAALGSVPRNFSLCAALGAHPGRHFLRAADSTTIYSTSAVRKPRLARPNRTCPGNLERHATRGAVGVANAYY